MLCQVYRYRHIANQGQKQQIKWVVLGMIASAFGSLAFFIPLYTGPNLESRVDAAALQFRLVSAAAVCFFLILTPIAIGISMMRYRLWNVDVLINRTLVYVPLTAILAGLYAASVSLLQNSSSP